MSDSNNAELKELIKTYGLSLDDVSTYSNYSLDRSKHGRMGLKLLRYRKTQDRVLCLLKYEIESHKLKPV